MFMKGEFPTVWL